MNDFDTKMNEGGWLFWLAVVICAGGFYSLLFLALLIGGEL